MSDPSSPARCQRILYAGNVQGVGFRFRTQQIAKNYDVAGYVKNLPDGRVEVVVAGTRNVVDEFLADIAEQLSGNINAIDTEPFVTAETYTTFDIRH